MYLASQLTFVTLEGEILSFIFYKQRPPQVEYEEVLSVVFNCKNLQSCSWNESSQSTDCNNKKKQQTEVPWSLIDRIQFSLMIYRNLRLMISRRSLKDKKGQTWAFSLLRQWLLLSTTHHYLERMVSQQKRKPYFTITFLNSNITIFPIWSCQVGMGPPQAPLRTDSWDTN